MYVPDLLLTTTNYIKYNLKLMNIDNQERNPVYLRLTGQIHFCEMHNTHKDSKVYKERIIINL